MSEPRRRGLQPEGVGDAGLARASEAGLQFPRTQTWAKRFSQTLLPTPSSFPDPIRRCLPTATLADTQKYDPPHPPEGQEHLSATPSPPPFVSCQEAHDQAVTPSLTPDTPGTGLMAHPWGESALVHATHPARARATMRPSLLRPHSPQRPVPEEE